MKCQCGNPMRQHVVALDDIWWICIICGRSKPAIIERESEPPAPKPPIPLVSKPVKMSNVAFAAAVRRVGARLAAPALPPLRPASWVVAVLASPAKNPHGENNTQRSSHMAKTLADLNEALFAQLDRLSVPDLKGEKLSSEIDRSRAVSNLAREIIENGKLALAAQEKLGDRKGNPKMLGVGGE